ncbi:MAG: hypothetical protein HF973_07920 [Chloroflexi bacterium]|nr:hypothetical protein [Chloroflexota bacterium]
MNAKRPLFFLISILFIVSLACNAFAGNTEPALELPPPLVTTEPGATPVSGLAPTATLPSDAPVSSTAVPGSATVAILVDLNIRSGPGVAYDRIGFFTKGATVPALGRDPGSGWWLVQCPPHISAPQCWVSGGPQYTQPNNADSVPVAPAPPTPTPIPTNTPEPTAEADTAVARSAFIAYTDDDGLWALPLDMSADPPAPAGDAANIVSDPAIQQILISPDGRRLAYLSRAGEANVLNVVNVNGSGQTTLVNAADLPVPEDAGSVAPLISDIAWLPDGRTLAFNSSLVNLEGPGSGSALDLYTVTVSGEMTAVFPPGSGGATFALSPDGSQVIFGLPESVVRANMDGTGVETVIEFDFINTASEYAYAPTAQWTADGSAAYVAIPSADPWVVGANAALYRIPVGETAVEVGSVLGNILFNPVQWTPNGDKLAYVQIVSSRRPPDQALTLADGDGQNPVSYRVGDQLFLHDWNAAGTYFLYAGNGFYAVGRPGESPVEITIPVGTVGMVWLNNSSFVTANGSGGVWNLSSSNLSGESVTLAAANINFIQFDVWAP